MTTIDGIPVEVSKDLKLSPSDLKAFVLVRVWRGRIRVPVLRENGVLIARIPSNE